MATRIKAINWEARTIACDAGRHGTAERRSGFDWDWAGCYGIVRDMDGYDRDCPCECHGTAERVAWAWLPTVEPRVIIPA